MSMDRKSIDAGIAADEDERAAHLSELHRLAKEAGYTVGSGAEMPELNPDGSYANDEDGPAAEEPVTD